MVDKKKSSSAITGSLKCEKGKPAGAHKKNIMLNRKDIMANRKDFGAFDGFARVHNRVRYKDNLEKWG